ncbi:hypothetical protein BH10ACI2_BH10ACI2_22840 [soil metagenome]
MKDFENKSVHARDLEYLLKNEPVDMSPEAVFGRISRLGEICDLSRLLEIAHLEEFRLDRDANVGRNN